MKEILQPGMHPDADLLSAFAEGAANALEREQMLAHLAGCAECREVVFLMQGQEETEAPAAKAAERRRWTWLMPAGLAGAALACGLAMVAYVRTHSAANHGAREIAGQSALVQAPIAPRSEAPTGTDNGQTAVEGDRLSVVKKGESQAAGQGTGGGIGTGASQKEQARGAEAGAVQGTVGSAVQMGVVAGAIASGKTTGAMVQAPAGPASKPQQASTPQQSQPAAAENAPVQLSGRNPAAPQDLAAGNAAFVLRAAPVLRIERGRGPDDGMSTVNGRVTDPTGATVAGAAVMLRNAEGKTFETTSGADGSFNLGAVPPGHYDLSVMARGFEQYRQAMDLKARDMAMLDMPLTVAAASQTVSVQAGAPMPQTSSPSVSSVQATDQAAELPSGLTAQTKVTVGKHVVSLDSAGALFVSRNAGKSWKKVKPQWEGRIVKIEAARAGSDLNMQPNAGTENAQTVFQATTDSGAVWTSQDGTHWHAQ